MKILLFVLALQSPPAAPEVSVKDGGREVHVTLLAEKERRPAVVEIRRHRLMHRSDEEGYVKTHLSLVDFQERTPVGLATEEKGKWKAVVTLPAAGRYEVAVGRTTARVWISRSGFRDWKKELRILQESADWLADAAREMDASSSMKAMKRGHPALIRECDKIDRLSTEFTASCEGLRYGAERLLAFPRVLSAASSFGGKSEFLPDDDSERPLPSVTGLPKALTGVVELRDYIQREATVKLVEELLMVLGFSEPGLHVVNRWKTREEAIREIAQAQRQMGSQPKLEEILKSSLERTEDDPLLIERLTALRKVLVK